MPSRFDHIRVQFHLPEGVIYFNANSLGPLPKAAPMRVQRMMQEEWGQMLITGWNRAGWFAQPVRLGQRLERLVGAEPNSIMTGDTLSIKVYQALSAALDLNPTRKVILSDSGNFPSDLYMAEGLCRTLGPDYRLKIVEPEQVMEALDDTIAVMMITEVDYRTGRRHDMAALTQRAHEVGALAIWDLAHSAGAFGVELAKGGADFGVGCTYKYLCSGPGGPAFIYVAPRHQGKVRPSLAGWQGHEAPFAFDTDYRPAAGVERLRVGTPMIIQMAALESALDIWDQVDLNDLRRVSLSLGDQFITGVEAACPDLTLVTPRAHEQRGSQICFAHEEGYAIMQALIARGLIGDFRAPNILRFGLSPLINTPEEVSKAIALMADVMQNKLWDRPEYKARAAVT